MYFFASATALLSLSFGVLNTLNNAQSAVAHPIEERTPANATIGEIFKRAGVAFSHCTVPNTVSISFDDGPWWYTSDIGNTLTNAGAKGTFFVNGANWGCIYDFVDQLRGVYNQGHQIASHTWAHRNLAEISWDNIHDEMWRVELALQRIIGAQPAWMRPPFGSYNQQVLDAANIRGQNLALWDFDSGDANGASAQQSKDGYSNLATQHPSNIMALNHETYAASAYDVLPHAISVLQNAGYQLVTVAECLGQPAYQWVGTPQTWTPDWHC